MSDGPQDASGQIEQNRRDILRRVPDLRGPEGDLETGTGDMRKIVPFLREYQPALALDAAHRRPVRLERVREPGPKNMVSKESYNGFAANHVRTSVADLDRDTPGDAPTMISRSGPSLARCTGFAA